MKEIYNGNYIQLIPDNLPQEQEGFWEHKGIHYEIQQNQFHFDIEHHFEYKNALKLILNNAFRKEIKNGEIAVNDVSWRTRYTFTKFPINNNPSKMLDLIEEEYNIFSYVKAILIAISVNTRNVNKTISTITPTVSTFSKSFKTIEVAQANNRLLKTTALNNKYFTVAEFNTFRNVCSTYADKHQDVYPKHSDKRAWFVAEQVYNFINSKGTYNLPSANSIQTQKSKINSFIKCDTIMDKVKKHYGKKYTDKIYSTEYQYQLKHNGKFTWEDPNYNAYVNRNELIKKIEDTNRPVREYIKTNMKEEWIDFEYHRKKDCANINNSDKLAYAKYCSDYIKKLIHNNKIPSTVSKNWKHWSAIK